MDDGRRLDYIHGHRQGDRPMHIAAHMQKIAKLEQTRSRLNPEEDFELWFWAAMHAGTHAFNAALHHAGITPQERAFAMQPGVYLVAQGDGTFVPELRAAPGDVLHVGRPHIESPLPDDVQRIAHAMERLEAYRDPCVREGKRPTREIIDTCAQAVRECLALLEARLSGADHAAA
jgi:hypothetical protein